MVTMMTSAKCSTEALKIHLAMEISMIPNHRVNIPCATHKFNFRHGEPRSSFIDWYLVLRVEEDADTDTIRKQYHKLALMLHPDKNHHPKADIAFKLVSEAYACLINEAKRRAFNSERWRRKDLCCDCDKLSNRSSFREPNSARQQSTPRNLKDIRKQMEEEARVIENCVRVNRKTGNEYPVFSPSSYLSQGYPHQQRGDYRGCFSRGNVHRRVKCTESPVFELRRDCIPLNVKSTCLTS